MLTAERLHEMVHYDPELGRFTWLKSNSVCIKVGTEAGAKPDHKGYRRIQIDGKRYKAQNLAWLYMTGAWPENEVDHKDRDCGNNRWENLRPATRKQNCENRRPWGSSGIRGVSKEGGKWFARIRHNGVSKRIGTFSCVDDAIAARKAAEDRLFTHHV